MEYNEEYYRLQNEKRVKFTTLLRENLPALLGQFGYKLIHDNKLEDQGNSHNWVFKLIFSGANVFEVSNDDWRDYTEYFTVYINGIESFVLKTDDYATADMAYADFKTKLLALI